MPSGENNLDDLLKGLSAEDVDEELEAEDGDGEDFSTGGFNNLTEDAIDRILSVKSAEPKSEEAYGDVLDMLEGTGDDELQDIQDMLQKSDRNEMIREESGYQREQENPADRLLADIEGADEDDMPEEVTDKKQRRALLKARRKEEKAAKKAARKAAKGAGKKGRKGERALHEGAAADIPQEVDLFDRDKLDSIVSGAGRFGRGNEALGAEAADREPHSGAGMVVEEVELEHAEDLVPDVGSDFAALDMDEIDALIPDITEKKGEAEGKKKGFMSKALSFLLEEEEEEPENENIKLSNENQQILDELDKEDIKDKAQKGKKKSKKKDKKKADKKAAKPKKAKPPKPKKEKKPKEEEPVGRRLTFKKMLPILLLGATVGAVVFIFVYISSDFMDKQVAETAFDNGDYERCYLILYGKKRSEAEEAMYGKSESILYMRLWYREYEIYMEEDRKAEALDSLIQTVRDYQALYEHALKWDAVPEVSEIYAYILNILYVDYAVTEEQALEIGAVKSDIEYTRIVTALAEGRSYKSWGRPALPEEDGDTLVLPDELPEESEMGQDGFVDNQ